MKKIILTPTKGTASAGFIFEKALNKKGEFEIESKDFSTIILLERYGAKKVEICSS